MRIALAQIGARLGDFDGICSRVEQQVHLAQDAGADLLCVPAPLMCGVTPGALVDYPNYEHDLLRALDRLAAICDAAGVACIVPAVLSLEVGQLFEAFLLRRGRVVPLRLTMIRHQEGVPVSPWSPPVFDVAGTRIAVTFDAQRDLASLPGGCDLLLHFPVNGLDVTDCDSAAAAALPTGQMTERVARAGIWMACMAPVGGYDDAVYTGGSYVLDDGGRVVALAPCFEESLLVQDVVRGVPCEAVEDRKIPRFDRGTWMWNGLRLHLRDSVAAQCAGRVLVALDGGLASSLLACLAVDALGSRSVIALHVEHDAASDGTAQEFHALRSRLAREVASRLRIRMVERVAPDIRPLLDGDEPGNPGISVPSAQARVDALMMEDVAQIEHAMPLSALTKTDYALRPRVGARANVATLAPFGDVYLTSLEWLARARNRISAVLPEELLGLNAVAGDMATVLRDAVRQLGADGGIADRALSSLLALDPSQIDGALEAHVDRNAVLDDLPLFASDPESAALILMIVRSGEASRRLLPSCPIVSSRSFVERAWPSMLGWSDMGRHGQERLRAADLADAEFHRLEKRGAARAERARGEIMDMLADLLGITPEQRRELMGEEGLERMGEQLKDAEQSVREALGRMASEGLGPEAFGLGSQDGDAGASGRAGFFSLN